MSFFYFFFFRVRDVLSFLPFLCFVFSPASPSSFPFHYLPINKELFRDNMFFSCNIDNPSGNHVLQSFSSHSLTGIHSLSFLTTLFFYTDTHACKVRTQSFTNKHTSPCPYSKLPRNTRYTYNQHGVLLKRRKKKREREREKKKKKKRVLRSVKLIRTSFLSLTFPQNFQGKLILE